MATVVEREDIPAPPPSVKKYLQERGSRPAELPVVQRPDKWTRLGNLLLAPSLQAQPLDRFLAVLRLVLVLTTDMLRSSNSVGDTVMTILGQHFVTQRCLGPPGGAPSPPPMVQVQEVCSYEPDEGPKPLSCAQGQQEVGLLHWSLTPRAKAKTKKLGREQYVKIKLGSQGRLTLHPPHPPLPCPPAPCPSPGPSELYEFSLPDLVIHDPLAPQAWLGLKGDLLLRCPSSGLTAALILAEDGAVEGQLEQRQPGSRQGRGSKRAGLGTQRLGQFEGDWRAGVRVQLSSAGAVAVGAGRGQVGAGKSGHSLTVLDNIAAGSGAAAGRLLPHADLAQLGPMQLPRLWSCLVDSLMYNSPLDAEGKGSEQLAGWLAHHFNGFPLGSEDPGGAPGGLAAPQPGAVQGAGPEASDEEEEGAAPGTMPEAAGGGPEAAALALAAQDKRRLPPCCKVKRAQGRALWYQLQLRLLQ
ncbi:hypothetical protein V8C86DRAFT_2888569 [Haematococcus lacustris]